MKFKVLGTPLSGLVHMGCTLCKMFLWLHCTLMVKRSLDIKQMILCTKTLSKIKYFSHMSNSMIFGGHFENMSFLRLLTLVFGFSIQNYP